MQTGQKKKGETDSSGIGKEGRKVEQMEAGQEVFQYCEGCGDGVG